MSPLLLTPHEGRVIAALVEKSITTPQYYPMTVNGLMLASNQKSSRAPVMSLTEGDVGAALNRLESDKLVSRDDLSGRVTKWRHHFQHYLLLKPGELAVLATLMLRGPQTASELRSNACGLGGPAGAEEMAAVLQSLSDRAQPLVVLLPRLAGQSSGRHAQTLTGPPSQTSEEAGSRPRERAPSQDPAIAEEFAARLATLERRVLALEAALETRADAPQA